MDPHLIALHQSSVRLCHAALYNLGDVDAGLVLSAHNRDAKSTAGLLRQLDGENVVDLGGVEKARLKVDVPIDEEADLGRSAPQ